ncbi:general amidase [Auricularia subglabra TFB-10046 SS5]|nr:general amidase [Auricularia subglabra TFB-10046 SS5]
MSGNWKELAAAKKQQQQKSIPAEWLLAEQALPPPDQKNVLDVARTCGLLNAREIEITETVDIPSLLQRLASGEWSAVDVTTAFYKRAIVAQQVVNCLTEVFVDRAIKRAKELDDHLKATGKPVGPLHGLPVSLKDQFSIEGLDTTMGYTQWIGKPASQNCTLVDVLLEAGAVPFVRTNIPQTLMWPETFNHIFGRSLNPHNRTLGTGGSSGGEGALVAFKGSPLGVGSDVGGSVRIPSACCGLYGLRPSYHRVPYRGAANSMMGQDSLSSVAGPLAQSLEAVKIFMQAVLGTKPWLKDPLALRKPWDEGSYRLDEHGGGRKLCFGVLWDDGSCKPTPPLQRAMEMTKQALLAAGHEVVDWEPLHHKVIVALAGQIWAADDGQDFRAALASTGEPLLTSMLPDDVAPPVEGALSIISGDTCDAYALWQLHARKTQLREEYCDHWNATIFATTTGRPVDAVISPVAPHPAPPHGMYRLAAYTTVFNVLDYPAAVIPITRVDPVLDAPAEKHEFRHVEDKVVYEMYTPEKFENAPVGLQIVGRTQEDEAVIAMAEIVDVAVKKYKEARGLA